MGSNSRRFVLCFLAFISISSAASDPLYESFLHCLSLHIDPHSNISQLLFTPNTSSFSSLLNSSIQNLRFTSPSTTKPLLIVTPTDETHVQASVLCCRSHGLAIRVRSGGHDYEGLSYRSVEDSPFVMVELSTLRSVSVYVEHGVAWVQAGATVGELLYRIAEKSWSHAFPAGSCLTMGVGGYISGGGFGNILRKYGLAADNVLDARLVDANGRLLDRDSMGEDLFWAIRGGGGSSFGIIVSWKVRLLPVPRAVTVFTVAKTLEQGAVELVNRWQYVAHRLHEDLVINVIVRPKSGGSKGVEVVFRSLFLGSCSELLRQMGGNFPELGVEMDDCRVMSWVRSFLYFSGYTGADRMDVLIDRGVQPKVYNKGKSDYVTDPIPGIVWERICERFMEEGAGSMLMIPHGGRMSEIPRNATPYPHRQGNLYVIQYLVGWLQDGVAASEKHLNWIKTLFEEMGPYVSKNPRSAYLNHRDLELGRNEEGNRTSYARAKVWGRKYFKSNFRRLARVKGEVDPENFFRFEQSIPPLLAEKGRRDT